MKSPLAPIRALLPSVAALFLLSHAFAADTPADPLAAGFKNPPASAKPWTWWHWVSGNVSKEGITADLEAMKKIGLGGAQLFTVDQSAVQGPVKFMSPEWRSLVKFALSEANRLHLVMSMEGCDGWSETGGPWVQPSESMEKVVWTERRVTGNTKITLDLPQPETIRGFYQDIALMAFSTPGGIVPDPASTTSSDPKFDGATINLSGTSQPTWIQVQYSSPETVRSLQFRVSGDSHLRSLAWDIQSSADGEHFDKIATVKPGSSTIAPSPAERFFRLVLPGSPQGQLKISQLKFRGPMLDQFDAQAGMEPSITAGNFAPTPLSPGETVDPSTLVNLTGQHDWNAPAGDWTIVRIGYTSTGVTTHPSTTPGLECDKLSRSAVQHHIENMYGPVFADSPSLVGNTFKYILLDSWEAKCENWTPKMPREFRARRGYDLIPWLPALTGKIIGSTDQTERFLWDFRRTIADLVAEEHYKTIQDFAHQHGMGLASEATGIGMPTIADQLLCKKYTDIPMGEFWVNRSREDNIDDPKEAASAAHVYGDTIAGAESFTSRPNTAAWTNDPYSLKALGDQEFCIGINRFIFHRYAHQPWMDRVPGMSMGPWGINFERTNTWWDPGAAWITYITRCQYLLQQGRYIADLCYFYGEGVPITVHHNDLTPAPPQGFSYDVCNADAILNLMTVHDGLITVPSGMQYRVLVLPPSDRMTLPVLKKIESLVSAGATVVGPKPLHSPSLSGNQDAELTSIANSLWADCDGKTVTQHAYGKGQVVWGQPLAQTLAVPPDFVTSSGDFLFIHRLVGNADVYFISSQSRDEITAQCTFRVAGKIPELWHPDTGACETLALYKSGTDSTTIPVHFDPTGSAFVVFRNPAPATSPLTAMKLDGTDLWTNGESAAATAPAISKNSLTFVAFKPGSYELATSSPSPLKATVGSLPAPLLLAGPWQIKFPPKLGAPASATFDHLISWTDSPDDGIKYFSGTATYAKDFTLPQGFGATGRRIYLDLGTVKNLARVFVNGADLGVLWKPPFRADITNSIHPGANHLEIRITNLWPNRLIGDQKLPENKRITWTSVSLYKADSPLLPSGLLGPVTILPAQKVSFDHYLSASAQ